MRKFDVKTLAKDWEIMMKTLLVEKKKHPITDYQPTRRYKKKATNTQVKLNIACGPNIFPYDGWINLDYADFSQYFDFIQSGTLGPEAPEHQRKLWKYCQEGGRIEFQQHDITMSFTQFAENSVDMIYAGQIVEHLNPVYQLPAFLFECRRMLKTGGVIRLTTPDLDILLKAYQEKKMHLFLDDQPDFFKRACPSMMLSHLMFGAGGPTSTQKNYEGHQACFNSTSLAQELARVGFSITYSALRPGESNSPVMAAECRDEGASHSIIMEAIK